MQPDHPVEQGTRHHRPDPVRLLAVSDLAPPHDVHLLIHAFAGVARWNPQAQLAVVGEGTEREALQAQVDACGLHDVVSLLGRVVPARLAEFLQRAHVFAVALAPQAQEAPCGVTATLAAAMAGGLCVVATESEETGRLVADGLSGLLVPAGEFHALSRALHLAVSNAALRRSLGEAAARGVRGGSRRSA